MLAKKLVLIAQKIKVLYLIKYITMNLKYIF